MSDFLVLLKKELKDMLRDKGLIFGILIVPLVIYPAFGSLMQVGFEQAEEETKVVITNFDEGPYGSLLIETLKTAPNITVTEIEAPTLESAMNEAEAREYNMIVVIPANFSTTIESNRKAVIEVYGIFRSLSTGMRESVSERRIQAVVGVLNEYLARLKISGVIEGEPEAVLHPIEPKSYSVIKGKIVDVSPSIVANVVAAQSFSIPLVIFIMLMLVAQMAAGTMAAEKENKTLETLLTLPVSRMAIVGGKMVGTGVIGLIAAGAYMVGMRSYLGSMMADETSLELADIGLSITPLGAALFALIMFLALLFALSFAMLLAIFAENTKSANTVVSAGIIPLALPTFVLMFADINTFPTAIRYVLLAIPFSHPVIASRAMLTA